MNSQVPIDLNAFFLYKCRVLNANQNPNLQCLLEFKEDLNPKLKVVIVTRRKNNVASLKQNGLMYSEDRNVMCSVDGHYLFAT